MSPSFFFFFSEGGPERRCPCIREAAKAKMGKSHQCSLELGRKWPQLSSHQQPGQRWSPPQAGGRRLSWMEVHNFSMSLLALSEVHRGSFSPAPSASVSVPSISHCLCPSLRWRDLSPSLTALASVCQLAPSLFLSHCLSLSVSLVLSPSLTLHEILPSSAQGSPRNLWASLRTQQAGRSWARPS